ncbi:MAG TPA: carboxypeptidase-like regulatory domain-containing protein [Anaerolineales bacterium]|nr:carboxypeptidase-like regulatory domain-containing protein [Anaerolineales bacterium]
MNAQHTAHSKLYSLLLVTLALATLTACGGARATIEGKAVWGSTPLANSLVQLQKLDDESGAAPTQQAQTNVPEQETQTDAAGKYTFDNVAPGKYFVVLKVEREGGRCVAILITEAKAGDKATLDFEIPETVSLAGGARLLPNGTIIRCGSG